MCNFLLRPSMPPDEVEQLLYWKVFHLITVGAQRFHSLFALPAGMSEQGPLLQGRPPVEQNIPEVD